MGLRHTAMLEVNEFLVLDFVREHGATSRPEIGRALGLSDSSVSRIVSRLLASGMVVETPGQATTAGRPRSTISFNNTAGCVGSIDLGGVKCRGALADLSGTTIFEDVRPTQGPDGPYGALAGATETLKATAAERGLALSALAVGIPSILDPETGRAVAGPAVDWEGFEIVERLHERVDVPFLVENDANLAALAHAWRGDGRGIRDFVTIVMGTGIGAAVVANGRLVKGRHNAAGEIGYLLMGREQLHGHRIGRADWPDERPGGLGGLEKVAAAPSLVRRARELAGGSGPLAADDLTAQDIFAAAADGDPAACEVIEELLDYAALTLGAITTLVDPEVVILDGGIGRSLEPYLGDLLDRLTGRLNYVPRLCISTLGSGATVLGGVAAALQLARQKAAPSALFGAFAVAGAVDRDA